MAKETEEYLVLKLHCGDEIIGKKNGSKKDHVLLHRPLQLQRSTLLDPLTGDVKKNICVFRDWLEFTASIECEIKTSHIMHQSAPSPVLLQKYLNELELLDNPSKRKPKSPKPQQNPSQEMREDILDNFFKSMNKQEKPPSVNTIESILSKLGGINQNPSLVTATFQMPPEVFLNIILNMPLFDMGDISDIDMGDEGEDFGDDDGEDDPKPPTPKNSPKKNKPKPNPDEEPPQGWNGRFGFPK
jgi:hypothetical protein